MSSRLFVMGISTAKSTMGARNGSSAARRPTERPSRPSTTIRTETTRLPPASSRSGDSIPSRQPEPALPLMSMFAYYDSAADIAWFPTGESDDVVSERVPGGLRDYDRATHKLVAIEVWDASTRLPASILEALPAPSAAQGAAA